MTQVQLSSAGPVRSIEHLAAEREDLVQYQGPILMWGLNITKK